MRVPESKRGRRGAPAKVFARLVDRARIEAQANGEIVARLDGHSIRIGAFGAAAAERLRALRTGLPLNALTSAARVKVTETDLLVQRLAAHRLLEYRLARDSADIIVIEPQVADYWPQMPPLGPADMLVLSRFAYLRRRDDAMVLESPRAGALVRICDPAMAAILANLSTPQHVKTLAKQDGFPGLAFLALLVDCRIVLKMDAAGESDHDLALWDFHDLLFHARSTEGLHANPLGGVYPHAGAISPLPMVRPAWPGKAINLGACDGVQAPPLSPVARLLRQRRSTRSFDDRCPITLAEVAQFLDRAARVLSQSTRADETGDGSHVLKPYPSAGASYELELYLAVNICEGLARGFYHYDAGAHALVPIGAPANTFDALLAGAAQAMGGTAAPQILITIAARFGRVSWKYSSIAYALILKDAGVLTQTLYLMAADMRLGGCAIGIANIDLFAKMTGLAVHVESPVGQFAIGRPATP